MYEGGTFVEGATHACKRGTCIEKTSVYCVSVWAFLYIVYIHVICVRLYLWVCILQTRVYPRSLQSQSLALTNVLFDQFSLSIALSFPLFNCALSHSHAHSPCYSLLFPLRVSLLFSWLRIQHKFWQIQFLSFNQNVQMLKAKIPDALLQILGAFPPKKK